MKTQRLLGIALVATLSGCGEVKYGAPGRFGHDVAPVRDLMARQEMVPADVEREIARLRDQAAAPLKLPVALAVSEGGASAAGEDLVGALRADPGAFRRVDPLPSTTDLRVVTPYSQKEKGVSPLDQARLLAAGTGADLLLVVEGEGHEGKADTPLRILDITLVGMFLCPSQAVGCKVRLTGALVDVASGRPVAFVSVEEEGRTYVPSALNDYDRRRHFQEAVKAKALRKLGAATAVKVRELAAQGGKSL